MTRDQAVFAACCALFMFWIGLEFGLARGNDTAKQFAQCLNGEWRGRAGDVQIACLKAVTFNPKTQRSSKI